jgi:hypothetical protein
MGGAFLCIRECRRRPITDRPPDESEKLLKRSGRNGIRFLFSNYYEKCLNHDTVLEKADIARPVRIRSKHAGYAHAAAQQKETDGRFRGRQSESGMTEFCM